VLVLVIVDTLVVALLAGLVAGLLRSHADILRALHSLGAGVGDPASKEGGGSRAGTEDVAGANPATTARLAGSVEPFHIGPPLPAERSSASAHDIEGTGPDGDTIALSVATTPRFTLLAFLSSGCSTCSGFWRDLAEPTRFGLPTDVRVVIVTRGSDLEIPSEVRFLAPAGVTVVMSSRAWDDYEVPGSPFFVLVDGRRSRRAGEGVGQRFEQVAELVRRAIADAEPPPGSTRPEAASHSWRGGLDGREREALNDRELRSAGIHPGHPSLYPTSLDDVFAGPPVEGADESDPDHRSARPRGRA
jgi:hypothetical protein